MAANKYRDGYLAGWETYLRNCKAATDKSSNDLLRGSWLFTTTEAAGYALSPYQQADYWLGYYHGWVAARAFSLCEKEK